MSSAASHGPSIFETSAVLIFDLDGTILRVNSFQNWARWLLLARFPAMSLSTRFGITSRALSIMLKRKLLRHDHERTKASLQRLWREAVVKDPAALNAMTAELLAEVRPNFSLLLDEVRQGRQDAVLATAAAEEYALTLAQELGFKHSLATPFLTDSKALQNVGTTKRDRTLEFLTAQNWQDRRRVFFTDHLEDLPLMLVSNHIIWLGTDDDLPALRQALPADIQITAARALDSQALLAVIQF
jgi:phosphoserine phosphatase